MSLIDLAICTKGLAPGLQYVVHHDQCGSGLFPIMVSGGEWVQGQHPSHWSMQCAKWEDFAGQIFYLPQFHKVSDLVRQFDDVVEGATKP